MRYFTLVIALVVSTLMYSQETKNVLFLGNSYTASNNLPDLVKNLAAADGNTLTTEMNTPGGYTFKQHSLNETSINLINSQDWDFVVLQAQSQEPSFPDAQVAEQTYPYAEELVNMIYQNNDCTIPLFFDTWGRLNGDPQWVGINTFDKMNQRLYNAYSYMANEAQGMLAPVGIAYAMVKNLETIAIIPLSFEDLYISDGSHPSIKGSYLTACVFNNIIFNKTSAQNTFIPNGISSLEADFLQNVADNAVYSIDSITVDYRPLANNDFSYDIEELNVTFNAIIDGGEFVEWNFGDGNTSNNVDFSHEYEFDGIYQVSMITSTDCYYDTVQKEIQISTLGLKENSKEDFKVYPNPSNGVVNIDYLTQENYTVYSPLGQVIYYGNEKQISLNSGLYYIEIDGKISKIIIK